MCANTALHAIMINKLEKNIYPQALALVNDVISSDTLNSLTTRSISSGIPSFIYTQLKQELESLFLYEQRLVFPSIVHYSDGNGKSESNFLPDIDSIRKLVFNKEKKIKQYLSDLNCFEISAHESKLLGSDKLLFFFEYRFFPAKALWADILNQLQNKQKQQEKNVCKNRINNICSCKKNKDKNKLI